MRPLGRAIAQLQFHIGNTKQILRPLSFDSHHRSWALHFFRKEVKPPSQIVAQHTQFLFSFLFFFLLLRNEVQSSNDNILSHQTKPSCIWFIICRWKQTRDYWEHMSAQNSNLVLLIECKGEHFRLNEQVLFIK